MRFEEMNMKYLECCFKLIEFIKENFLEFLTKDRSRYCQLNVPTFRSIYSHLSLILENVLSTKQIYSLYCSSNADRFPEEIKLKLDKHIGLVEKCRIYWYNIPEIWNYDNKAREIYVTEELIKPSSTEEERRKIEDSYIQKLLDPVKCELENIISSFNEEQIEDKNGRVGKALQSLRQLHAPEFN